MAYSSSRGTIGPNCQEHWPTPFCLLFHVVQIPDRPCLLVISFGAKRSDMITQTTRKHLLCVNIVRARKINSQRKLVCHYRFQKVFFLMLWGALQLHKLIPNKNSCVTDVLWDWEIKSQIITNNMCAILLSSMVCTSKNPHRSMTW